MRSRRLRVLVVVATVFGLLGAVLAALTVVRPTLPIAGTAVMAPAPPVTPGKNPVLDPLPTLPTQRWRVDSKQLFGTADNSPFVVVIAAIDDIVVAKSMPGQFGGAGQIIAVSPDDGRLLWEGPSDFLADGCTFSRDARLACTSRKTRTVGFLDPQSGRVLATQPVEQPGRIGVRRAGDGFLVTSVDYVDDVEQDGLTWFSSDGSRTWSQALPPKLDTVELSEAGNVVTAYDYKAGGQAYELDTGLLLYDAGDDLAQVGSSDNRVLSMMPSAAGFAVSIYVYASDGGTRLTLYDSYGAPRKVLPDWKMFQYPDATEGTRIVVQHQQGYQEAFGVLDAATREVLWELDGDTDWPYLVGNDYLVIERSKGWRHGYTVYTMSGGDERGTFELSIYPTLRGFDGQRLIFEGDENGDDPGPDGYTAIDVGTGEQVWRIKDYGQTPGVDAFPVNFNTVGPFFFRYDAQVGDSVASIALLASP